MSKMGHRRRRRSRQRKRLWSASIGTGRAAFLFENGTGNTLKGVAGTMWAAYNGVAELIDHGKTRRTDAQRLEHIWFGSGAGVKARAFARAVEMVGVRA